MSRDMLKYAGIALGVLVVVIAVIVFLNRGSHVVVEGSIQQVRVQEMDKKSAVALVDFRFTNPSNYPLIVRTITMVVVDRDGLRHEGMTVSEADTDRLFQYFPLLGQKFNRTLKIRDRVEAHQSMDRMLCARFEVPDSTIETRRQILIRVEDVDGAISEIAEAPRK